MEYFGNVLCKIDRHTPEGTLPVWHVKFGVQSCLRTNSVSYVYIIKCIFQKRRDKALETVSESTTPTICLKGIFDKEDFHYTVKTLDQQL